MSSRRWLLFPDNGGYLGRVLQGSGSWATLDVDDVPAMKLPQRLRRELLLFHEFATGEPCQCEDGDDEIRTHLSALDDDAFGQWATGLAGRLTAALAGRWVVSVDENWAAP